MVKIFSKNEIQKGESHMSMKRIRTNNSRVEANNKHEGFDQTQPTRHTVSNNQVPLQIYSGSNDEVVAGTALFNELQKHGGTFVGVAKNSDIHIKLKGFNVIMKRRDGQWLISAIGTLHSSNTLHIEDDIIDAMAYLPSIPWLGGTLCYQISTDRDTGLRHLEISGVVDQSQIIVGGIELFIILWLEKCLSLPGLMSRLSGGAIRVVMASGKHFFCLNEDC
jgi:hypothetical protein